MSIEQAELSPVCMKLEDNLIVLLKANLIFDEKKLTKSTLVANCMKNSST